MHSTLKNLTFLITLAISLVSAQSYAGLVDPPSPSSGPGYLPSSKEEEMFQSLCDLVGAQRPLMKQNRRIEYCYCADSTEDINFYSIEDFKLDENGAPTTSCAPLI